MKGILTKLADKFGFVPKPEIAAPQGARNYGMAQANRLTADWVASPADVNQEMRYDIRPMRYRARQQERDNNYINHYLRLLENNVLGHAGIGLEMKITEDSRKGVVFDTRANQIIEKAWADFNRRENFTLSGQLTGLDFQKLVIRSVARDGALLAKDHMAGRFSFTLEPLEIDHLDVVWSQITAGGSEIRNGIQYDAQGKIEGYWVFDRHPGSLSYGGIMIPNRKFIPAQEIFHFFKVFRVGQATGVPWLHTCSTQLRHLAGYEEAEVIASRAAASKMAFLIRETPVNYNGIEDADGNQMMEVSPGSIEQLPVGIKDVKPFDPTHPNSNMASFIKAELRGIASGLGVSYTSLSSDLEGVNYSSIRAGLLEERENWKALQVWFIEWVMQPIFERWLQRGLANGSIPLPASKFDKFNKPEWKPRRWDWVDPLKDVQASVLAIENRLTSRRQVISEGGGDIENVFQDLAADKELAKSILDEDLEAEKEDPKAALTEKENQNADD